jgi:hypothetical protein
MAADGEGERGRQGDLESGARKRQHLAEVATGAERSLPDRVLPCIMKIVSYTSIICMILYDTLQYDQPYPRCFNISYLPLYAKVQMNIYRFGALKKYTG